MLKRLFYKLMGWRVVAIGNSGIDTDADWGGRYSN